MERIQEPSCKEIGTIVNNLDKKVKKEEENTFIVLGDFNIISPEHETMKALNQNNFIIPESLQKLPSNVKQAKHYDQIAFKTKKGHLEFSNDEKSAGVYNYFKTLYTD